MPVSSARKESSRFGRIPVLLLLAVFCSTSFLLVSHFYHGHSLGELGFASGLGIQALKLRLHRKKNATLLSSTTPLAANKDFVEVDDRPSLAHSNGAKPADSVGITKKTESQTEQCSQGSEKEYPWPFYKVSQDEHGSKWSWPGVGWNANKLSIHDETFRRNLRFYLYDDGPFNTTLAEECYKSKYEISPDMSNIDYRIPVFRRMYSAEPAIWPALRAHELRTLDPEKASLFVIGYSPFMAEGLTCAGMPAQWEDSVVARLNASKYYQRHGGQDHMIFIMRFALKIGKPLQSLLDAGSLVVTTDRFFWNIIKLLPNAFKSGSVLIAPYVSPYLLDHADADGSKVDDKHPDTWYFFAGTYKRRYGSRGKLAELAEFLSNVNFTDIRIPKTIAPGNGLTLSSPEIVAAAVAAVRRSSVCMSPQGDAITSGRLFEALAGGCVPIVIAPRDKMQLELPLPSLIDWDNVALFTDNFDTISKKENGIEIMGKALEQLVGPHAGQKERKRLECMQRAGRRAFFDHLSFFNNPNGLTTSLLLEAWVLLQKRGVIGGPYAKGA